MMRTPSKLAPSFFVTLVTALLAAPLAWAAAPSLLDAEQAEAAAAEALHGSSYRGGFEIKMHYRDSEEVRFPSPFPFDPVMLPQGATLGFLETPDAGEHFEVSMITLWGEANWGEKWSGKLKIDIIDRYDRNPTSADREVDIDEAWLRYGREVEPGEVPEARGFYVKLGKFGKFERQDQRNLESYGLVGTASNRLEDIGLEAGIDLSRHVYLKLSLTHGNPLFLRDPNALAGDNGTEIFNFLVPGTAPNPVSEIKTGLPIFYDTDIDTVDFKHPEIGLGLGGRWASPSDWARLDVLAFYYDREMYQEANLANTFYGGDLDMLRGPLDAFSFAITDDRKTEWGLTSWIDLGDFRFFGQYLDQDIAGLERTGFEVEGSWNLKLPYLGAVGGRQVLPWIRPVVRFSGLDNDFAIPEGYPGPSVGWDWDKLDIGLRVAILRGIELTLEHSANEFTRKGTRESYDELLVTLRIAMSKAKP